MIIFLYGPDGYRLNREAESIVQKYRQRHSSGVNFFNFDLTDNSIRNVEDTIKTVSFFDEIKLAIVRSVFSIKDSTDFLELVKNYDLANDKKVVFLVRENSAGKDLMLKNKKLFELLSGKKNLIRNFESLIGQKLGGWVRKEFHDRNCVISPITAGRLIDVAGKNTFRLISEIDKISNYKLESEVRLEDIDKLVNPNIELNIFRLLDAIAASNKPKALELLYSELETGRDPYYILTMITYQLRNTLVIKDLTDRGLSAQEISKRAGIHPFVVKKSSDFLNRLSPENLKIKFNQLCLFELNSKSGISDLTDSLYGFVLT